MGLKAGQSNLQGSFDSRNSKRSGQRAVVMTSGTNRHSPEGRARVKMLVNRMKWKGKHWEEWEQLGAVAVLGAWGDEDLDSLWTASGWDPSSEAIQGQLTLSGDGSHLTQHVADSSCPRPICPPFLMPAPSQVSSLFGNSTPIPRAITSQLS